MVAQKVRFAASFSCVPREASGHDVHAHVKTRARVVRARSTWSEACRAPPLINFFFFLGTQNPNSVFDTAALRTSQVRMTREKK